MNILVLHGSRASWLEAGGVPREDLFYAFIDSGSGNVRPFQATIYKGGSYFGRTGFYKSFNGAKSAAYDRIYSALLRNVT